MIACAQNGKAPRFGGFAQFSLEENSRVRLAMVAVTAELFEVVAVAAHRLRGEVLAAGWTAQLEG
jgi:predicted pyridoxine 5'-phosphate oxidase superfamily flavin-nucleotide-binding protein